MFRLLVDFNEVTPGDGVRGLQEYADAPRPLRPGDYILVHDDGEEEALGTVASVDDDVVDVAVEWATFGPAGRFQFASSGLAWTVTDTLPALEAGRPNPLRVIRASLTQDEDEHPVEIPA